MPGMTHVAEQRALKEAFLAAAVGTEADQDDYLFTQKRKTKEETEKEALEFALFQEGVEKAKIKPLVGCSYSQTSSKNLQAFWQQEPVDENEKFLRNFIVNKGWINSLDMPTYEEIVKDVNVDLEQVFVCFMLG